MGGGGVGFSGVDRHSEAGFGSQVEAFVGNGKAADDVVVEVFDTGAVGADIVGAPAAAELVAAGRQLPTKSWRLLLCGSCPAAARRLATVMSAAKSQSG
jgi:hypothetical protein